MLWWVGFGLVLIWFILTFVLHRRGWVHILLLAGISILIVQFAAYRKAKYQQKSSGG
jgi:hypothetical protein